MTDLVIYDSGLGGKAVFDLLGKQLSAEHSSHLNYFADHLHFPYGRKTEHELQVIVSENLRQFEQKGYQLVGVACNTASTIIDTFHLDQQTSIPVITIIQPTIDKVLQLGKQRIHLIASQFTVQSNVYGDRLFKIAPQVRLSQFEEQTLIEAIEKNEQEVIVQHIQRLVEELDPTVEVLVLACTHFAFIKDQITKQLREAGKNIELVDSAEELAGRIVGIA